MMLDDLNGQSNVSASVPVDSPQSPMNGGIPSSAEASTNTASVSANMTASSNAAASSNSAVSSDTAASSNSAVSSDTAASSNSAVSSDTAALSNMTVSSDTEANSANTASVSETISDISSDENIPQNPPSASENRQADTSLPSDGGHGIPLLEFRGVTKRYGSKKVLDGISFTVRRGGVIGLLGPNGSGKTTVIKLICGLLTTTSGEVRINGLLPSPETAAMISYLPDRNYLPLGSRVCDLLNLFSDFYRDFDRVKACDMLARLGISQNERMRTMSKGTREKLQLVFVMSRRASLYVLDEPLAGVDPAARDYILSTILSNYAEGSSILLSTHLIADVERVLDDVIFLADGKAAFCASVEALKKEYGKTVDELFREVYRC